MSDTRSARPLRAIVGDVAQDAQFLVRGELELARLELDSSLNRAVLGLVRVFGGMFVGFAGLIVILMAAVDALTFVIPAWAAALVVGVLIAAIGGLLTMTGLKSLKLRNVAPQRTMRNVRQDAQLVQDHT
jgi:hypothetical protein